MDYLRSIILCNRSLYEPLLVFHIRRVRNKVSVPCLYDFFIKHFWIGEINISQKVSATGMFVWTCLA